MKLYRIIIIAFILNFGTNSNAQKNIGNSNIEQLVSSRVDELANTFLKDTLMKSLSVGIYHNGEEFTRHYGELEEGKNNKPTNKTIYEIASVTKTFVGTLIAKAELEGKLSIEDDIRDFLDGDYPNLQYENQPIKIKHLITHTSELPPILPLSVTKEFEISDADLALRISKIQEKYSREQFFDDIKQITLDTVPGYRYAYSGPGAELASFILERVYKMPFEKLLNEELFKKANMTSTMIQLSKADKGLYANGYGSYNNVQPSMKTNLWGGSGFGKSTVADLMNYIKYQLDEDNEVFKKSHQILFDKDMIDGDPRNKMGYLWQVSTDGDFGQFVKHHGGGFGVQNWLYIFPEEKLGISVITNQSGRQTGWKLYTVVSGILDEIANDKNQSNKSETEQITETLMDYIEGSTNGQPNRLNKAFHPDLDLYYMYDREFRTWSGKAYIEDTKEGEPTGETGKILLIDYENNIATAKVLISHPENNTPYVDYLMLMKINGHWKIIHKMFTQKTSK